MGIQQFNRRRHHSRLRLVVMVIVGAVTAVW